METQPVPGAAGIRKITLADRETVGRIMCRALDDDPLMRFLVKADGRREERLRRFMDAGLMKLTSPTARPTSRTPRTARRCGTRPADARTASPTSGYCRR